MKAIPEQTIAHYRILEPIGAGGMGAVHKAYDKQLQRVVAIKLLMPEYVSHQVRRRRFFQEARAASVRSAIVRAQRALRANMQAREK